MYAVVETGGKQYRVISGQTLEVEKLSCGEGREVSLRPLLLVDDGRVLARPADLTAVTVTARVIGEHRGPKIRGFTYKPKTNQRRRWGHRQALCTIQITGISTGAADESGDACTVAAADENGDDSTGMAADASESADAGLIVEKG